ncbi:trypsin-like peptidase domain-containing protein [Pelagimonas varians]|uniref:Periplasmic pH-dependent serine endoprotease DegQ n=1 Tax=Pelagimonas varians TaxID=696760 RepID=A0A238K755_9RHOB|nr:trypsin-like peptidase domain-containing protein [Pelagimonas varians]PYG30334.1 Do/DeqQ family serine protease [Pelagimonas varians]SMX37932.1 Periplasmic pH-dependent serine endoprotease DegQ precursor [Pelagimonas varians]
MLLRLCLILTVLAAPLWAETRVPQSQVELSLSFAPLVKQATPAVVNIYARRIVEQRNPFADDPFFSNLFRDFKSQPQVQNSLGSGVILSDDGIVVSNYHVVGMATDIRVVLTDRREFEAYVVLADQESDLAILKLRDATDMPHLTLRDSDTVEVGELVLAIGNPFGVGQTVSSGIVSGLARSGAATGNGRGYFIQTDAAINPGNSGGALIDIHGALIGVNTSILTKSGGSNGIGFAIPSALVGSFVDQARLGHEQFQRPWAGMTGQPVTADLSESLGLGIPSGVLIAQLHDKSPFKAAGLRPGDVVLSVDDLPVNTPAEMLFRMSVRSIGQDVRVTFVSREETKDASVTLMTPPDSPEREQVTLGNRDVLPGLTIARINPAVLAELGLSGNAEGIIVLDTGHAGSRVGLRRGDVILGVSGKQVTSTGDVTTLLKKSGRRIRLDVLRGDRRITLQFRT